MIVPSACAAPVFAFVVRDSDAYKPSYSSMNASMFTDAGSNLVGYLKCSSDAQKRLQSATSMATGAIGGLSALAAVPGALPALGSSLLGMFGAVTAPTTAAAAGAGAAASVATAGAVAPAIAVTSASASSFTSPSGASGRQAAVRQQPGSSNSTVNSGVISDFDAVSDPFGTGKRHNDIVSI